MAYKTEVFIERVKTKETSGFAKFIASFCPCLKKKSNKGYKLDTLSEKDDTFVQNESEMFDLSLTKTNSRTNSTKPSFVTTLSFSSKYDTDVEDYFSKKITPDSEIHRYVSVHKCEEDRLILLGKGNQIPIKIQTKLLKMSAHSAEKTKTTLDKVTIKTPKFPNAKMEGWWKKRYILFDKFDQGIKFDEESYISTPPESLASYIASRLKFNKLLHVYAGIGAYDIKLSVLCENIVATDIPSDTKQCISNNLQVYNSDGVQIADTPFLQMQNQKFDGILITPPWGQGYTYNQQLDIRNMKIDQLFYNGLKMSSNIVLVLPSNINIQQLAQQLSKGLYKASGDNIQNCFSSCSFQIQKICFMDRIRFIVVYYGTFVNRSVKLPEQLDLIYDIVGNATFKCRRITKYIRQEYGLPYLLNLSLRVQNQSPQSGQSSKLDSLIQIIQRQKIIPDAKLKSFLNKTFELKKTTSKKIRVDGQNAEEIQQIDEPSEVRGSQKTQTYTNSFISSYDVGGRDTLQGTKRTINIECSATGSVKLSKHELKMSGIDSQMTNTKIR